MIPVPDEALEERVLVLEHLDGLQRGFPGIVDKSERGLEFGHCASLALVHLGHTGQRLSNVGGGLLGHARSPQEKSPVKMEA